MKTPNYSKYFIYYTELTNKHYEIRIIFKNSLSTLCHIKYLKQILSVTHYWCTKRHSSEHCTCLIFDPLNIHRNHSSWLNSGPY